MRLNRFQEKEINATSVDSSDINQHPQEKSIIRTQTNSKNQKIITLNKIKTGQQIIRTSPTDSSYKNNHTNYSIEKKGRTPFS